MLSADVVDVLLIVEVVANDVKVVVIQVVGDKDDDDVVVDDVTDDVERLTL